MHVYDYKKDGELKNHPFQFEVEMKKPSELFMSLERINYIKCDVEGFEYNILSEMKEIIGKHKPIIQVEIVQSNKCKVKHLLEEMGYIGYKLSEGKLQIQEQELEKSATEFLFINSPAPP